MLPARPAILQVERLRVAFHSPHGVIRAIADANLEVREGEAVGLVGESGSGKSSLARACMGLLPSTVARLEAGRIVVDGRDVTRATEREWVEVRGHPAAIVFQDPLTYLNPIMRVGRQIAESVERHDPGAAVDHRVAELLDLVRLPASSRRAYPHELSGGMRQRALLAVALGCRPRLLVADEPTTALDVTTQAEILALIAELRQRLGMALLLISHDLAVIASACDHVHVMYAGSTVESGPCDTVFARPAHPYTVGLLRAATSARDAERRFATIRGDVPNLAAPFAGCRFADRCDLATGRCVVEMPPAVAIGGDPGHTARCWESTGAVSPEGHT